MKKLSYAAGLLLAGAYTASTLAIDTTEDPRKGLKAGVENPGVAISNLKLVHSLPMPEGFNGANALWSAAEQRARYQAIQRGEKPDAPPSPISFANSDLAFTGSRVIMGNFHGLNIFDFPEGKDPKLLLSLVCPGGQGDVSVKGNLIFYSVEQNRGRLDCGPGGVKEKSSSARFRGVRIFDVSDISNPRQVAAVQTCRGSHTHTLVPHPSDDTKLYIYVSGTAGVRPADELAGCVNDREAKDSSYYSIDIIEVELDKPEEAKIINSPRIFADKAGNIAGLWTGGKLSPEGQRSSQTNSCHDITVYPAKNLAAGACAGNGILLDIKDPANPVRIADIADENMAYWHSANFNNDATRVLFTDEWGGGLSARCQASDPANWGADVVMDITDEGFKKRGFFKIPGVQSATENCVAHNGSLIPVPGRDILVQAWYSGGISVIDFTDPDNIFEIAYFDRGPLSADQTYLGGYWAAYWHNGKIYAPEITRGLDVFELTASQHLSQAEIDAAVSVRFDEANTQTQEQIIWPDQSLVDKALKERATAK